MSAHTDIKTHFDNYLLENEKFDKGNSAAGTRARKALAEMSKAIKARRNEITDEKNSRKEAKVAPAAPAKVSAAKAKKV